MSLYLLYLYEFEYVYKWVLMYTYIRKYVYDVTYSFLWTITTPKFLIKYLYKNVDRKWEKKLPTSPKKCERTIQDHIRAQSRGQGEKFHQTWELDILSVES